MQWLAVLLVLPYVYMLLKIYRGLLHLKTFVPGKPSEIHVSVIIPCRNEEKNLPLLLNDLASQDYPENLFEIIIVDDKSTDKTFEIASKTVSANNLKVIRNKGTGKKEALRTGIDEAGSSLIITTDADCRPGRGWIQTIASFCDRSAADLIVCPVKLKVGNGITGKFTELEFLSLQGVTAGCIASGNPSMCNGANLAFRKETYMKHRDNLHSELASGDDVFLLHSIKKDPEASITWIESMDAAVMTASESSITGFLKQRRRWISKASAYDDRYTMLLGIVTFVTILLQSVSLAAAFFDHTFIYIFLLVFVMKSIPDFLILMNTTRRYGKTSLMAWFIPSQLIYPFYVLIISGYALISPGRKH